MTEYNKRAESTTNRLARLQELGVNVTSKALANKLDQVASEIRTKHAAENGDDELRKETRAAITRNLDGLVKFFVRFFLVLGSAAVIVFFPAVETWAIKDGMLLVKNSPSFALFSAFSLVLGSIVFLFITHLLEDNVADSNRVSWRGVSLPEYDQYETEQRASLGQKILLFFYRTNLILSLTIISFGIAGRRAEDLLTYQSNLINYTEDTVTGQAVGLVAIALAAVWTLGLIRVVDGIVLFIYSLFVSRWGVLEISGGEKSSEILKDSIVASQNDYLDLLILREEAKLLAPGEPTEQ